MTESLRRAFDVASRLPEAEQDAFATWVLSELESEKRWSELFVGSQDQLASLADAALEEHARGETRDLDAD